MKNHFCTCPDKDCDKHPVNHGSGCDLCIRKNLDAGEIPGCFWVAVGGDFSGEKEYTMEKFAEYFQRNRSRYLQERRAETKPVIRLAEERDLPAIAEHVTHIPEHIIREKITRGEIYVVHESDKFIGWLSYSLFWDIVPFMNMLEILPGHRGRGTGRRLVQFWENEMKTKGHKQVMTSTQQNEQAQHFYGNLGYVCVGGFVQTLGVVTDESYEILFTKEL